MTKYLDPHDGSEHAAGPTLWRPTAADPFELAGPRPAFQPAEIDRRSFSLWRYAHTLPDDLRGAGAHASLGEGCTALVPAGEAAPNVLFKLEYAMPTLSFKDRGAAVMLAQAASWGVDRVAVDSSGNAACAIAAYAAHLGMAAEVFVPEATSTGKLRQIEAYGADIHRIPGDRQRTAEAAAEYVDREGLFYASHVYNPLFHEGTKTMVYELWEQLDGHMPERLYLPVGNGTMLIGAALGLDDLEAAEVIDARPEIVAVQSEACAPLARAFAVGLDEPETGPAPGKTIAEGIAIASPARGRQILAVMRHLGGRFVTVADAAVTSARQELARAGFDVEPTAAVCYAAWRADTPARGQAVIPLCGAGLKSPY